MNKMFKIVAYVICGVFGSIFLSYGMAVAIHQTMSLTMLVSLAIVFMAWLAIAGILTVLSIEGYLN